MQLIIAEQPGAVSCRPGRVPFTEALAQADVISLHCPLNADTHHIVDARSLAGIKRGAVLIISLILLVLITLIGVASSLLTQRAQISPARQEELLGNLLDRHLSGGDGDGAAGETGEARVEHLGLEVQLFGDERGLHRQQLSAHRLHGPPL